MKELKFKMEEDRIKLELQAERKIKFKEAERIRKINEFEEKWKEINTKALFDIDSFSQNFVQSPEGKLIHIFHKMRSNY